MAGEPDGDIQTKSLRFDKILVYTSLMILYFVATYKLFRRHRLVVSLIVIKSQKIDPFTFLINLIEWYSNIFRNNPEPIHIFYFFTLLGKCSWIGLLRSANNICQTLLWTSVPTWYRAPWSRCSPSLTPSAGSLSGSSPWPSSPPAWTWSSASWTGSWLSTSTLATRHSSLPPELALSVLPGKALGL